MKKPKYLNDKDPWLMGEDVPDMDFFFSQIWISGFANEFHLTAGGKAYKKVLSIHQGYHLWFYYGENDSKEVGDRLVKKFLGDPDFVKKVNVEIVKKSDDLTNFAKTLPIENLSKYSNKQLWQFFKKHDRLHTIYYQWGWTPVAVDMFHSNLTEKIKQYLRSIDVTEDKVSEYFMILTQPIKKSLIQIEQEDFLHLVGTVQKDKYHGQLFKKNLAAVRKGIKPNILQKVKKYHAKYFYIARMWIGKVSTLDYYLEELIKLVKSDIKANQVLKNDKKSFDQAVKKRAELIKKLKIKGSWRVMLDGFGGFMITKIYRRYAQLYTLYRMDFILKETAKRLNLTLKEVRFMLPQEIEQALLTGSVPRQILKERTKFCVYFVEKGFDKIYIGKEAKKLAKLAKPKIIETSELKGQTGCIGKAKGKVRIVIRPKDMAKMKKGDILVSIATDPDIVAAMKKAAAIVTEQGGVTSHAAIVSRELNIPCVIGTKIATKVLKDGDLVEVDATKGTVKKI